MITDTQAARCVSALRARGETLATAESLTAGLISSTLASVPGASDVLRGGLTAYATEAKMSVLGVPASVLDQHGAVSRECALAMAEAGRGLFGGSWGVAATGVAGPDPQEGHPPGLVYVAVAGPGEPRALRVDLTGDRQQIRHDAVSATLELLLVQLGHG